MERMSLWWPRCPAGYKIVDYGPGSRDSLSDKFGRRLVPLTEKVEYYQVFSIPDLFMKFASLSNTDSDYIAFSDQYGVLHYEENGECFVDDWPTAIAAMQRMVDDFVHARWDSIRLTFSGHREGEPTYLLATHEDQPGLVNYGTVRPKLVYRPVNLPAAMQLQLQIAVSEGLGARRCEACEIPLLYGPGTGRRSTVRFCSTKCQQAARRRELQRARETDQQPTTTPKGD